MEDANTLHPHRLSGYSPPHFHRQFLLITLLLIILLVVLKVMRHMTTPWVICLGNNTVILFGVFSNITHVSRELGSAAYNFFHQKIRSRYCFDPAALFKKLPCVPIKLNEFSYNVPRVECQGCYPTSHGDVPTEVLHRLQALRGREHLPLLH